ncbi:IgG-binding virulence factor TspB family protein [Conchiformibius kuhniae]|uniref:IgG-binding virulence factor TspB family protein n=1 Tax=Conchiformibius kuhniae TaxID=211502 RepID=A0A8T9MVI2_9NEIS|nr:IgG-binding virulence factor TspB family protein [Conchiformibius kuhniae]UOP04476.1 hypothetical protein LVJ77_09305 [Conchiformibius kuhniae]
MKKILLAVLLFVPLCHAENVAQITGGNYIFADAENQRLIFNFEPSTFENRQWDFDEQSDNATTQFTIENMPLKTLHSSEFHAYERVAGTYTIVATYNPEQHRAMLMRPVYRPNVNDGERVRVWLPAAVGWIVRVGGTVARNVLPPIITRCLSNDLCKSVAYVVPTYFCFIDAFFGGKEGFFKTIGFPQSFCKTAEEEGYKPEQVTNPQTGKQGQTYAKEYPYVIKGHWGKTNPKDCEPGHEKECAPEYRQILIGANSAEHARSIANDMCKKLVGTSYTGIDHNNHDNYGLTGKVKSAELLKDGNSLTCTTLATDENGEDFIGPGFSVKVLKENHKEIIKMVDVVNLVSKDFKKNPTPYINDKGQVGKELRNAIKPQAAVAKKDGSGGSLTASSPPYLDPKTGKAVQDNVRITATPGKKSDLPPPSSGGAGNGAGGNPSTGSNGNTGINNGGGNTVNVTTTPRPDKQSEAVAAGNNTPNGTNPPKGNGQDTGNTSGSGNGSGGSGGGKKGDGGGLDCAGEHRNTLACAQMGTVDEAEQPFDIPTTQNDKTYQPDNFMPTSGQCPAPKHVVIMGRTYTISYNWLCQFAQKIRMIIVGLAYLMAAYIIFTRKE